MTKPLPLAIQAVCTAAFALMAISANAQSSPPGRTAFDQNGCRECHAYASRRGGPSVRDMLAAFEGDPEKALKGIGQPNTHSSEKIGGAISEKDMRAMAEWISGATLAEPEPAPVTPSVVQAPIPAAPPAPQAIEVISPAPINVEPAIIRAIPSTPTSTPNTGYAAGFTGGLTGLIVEPGKKADRLVITLSGREPEQIDIRSVDGKLVITLPGIERSAKIPAIVTADKNSSAISDIQSVDDHGTLIVTVSSRAGDLKYTATQGRNRLSFELTAIPSKKKTVANNQTLAAPVPAVAKVAIDTKTPAEKTKATTKPIAEKTVVAKSEVVAKVAPVEETKEKELKAKEAKAKQEAEAKAKKEAEAQAAAQAQAKKETEVKIAQAAAKKEADEKAKRDSSAASKAEVDMLAALKASAEALKGGSSASAGGDATTKGGRQDRSKMKAPEKFRDEPCPPLAETDPIGNVDEARAKDIMERVGCPQCHAFVQKKTGPPFKRVFEKVKGNPSCVIKKLKTNKEHREEGVTDDLKGQEFKIVADYVATRAK